jgi:hypothetical protein
MKRKKKSSFPVKPALLLGVAAVLLLGSTVGSTRAALTYYSEEYSAQVSMSSIGVTLLENDTAVRERRYTERGTWETTGDGVLLKNMLDEGETPVPGKTYPEAISVANTGSIDTFVRVIINRYWTDASGEKTEATTGLSPDLIKLNLANEGKWIYDEDSDYPDYSPERMVLYYSEALSPKMKTEPLSDTLQIDPSILNDVVIKETKSDDGTWTRTYAYKYDGYSFHLEAEVNAVQTHNAVDAIKSAWGVDVTLSEDGTAITGINH